MSDHRDKCLKFAHSMKYNDNLDQDEKGFYIYTYEASVIAEYMEYCPFCGRKLSEDEK